MDIQTLSELFASSYSSDPNVQKAGELQIRKVRRHGRKLISRYPSNQRKPCVRYRSVYRRAWSPPSSRSSGTITLKCASKTRYTVSNRYLTTFQSNTTSCCCLAEKQSVYLLLCRPSLPTPRSSANRSLRSRGTASKSPSTPFKVSIERYHCAIGKHLEEYGFSGLPRSVAQSGGGCQKITNEWQHSRSWRRMCGRAGDGASFPVGLSEDLLWTKSEIEDVDSVKAVTSFSGS